MQRQNRKKSNHIGIWNVFIRHTFGHLKEDNGRNLQVKIVLRN